MHNPLRLITQADAIVEVKPLPQETAREQLARIAPARPIEVVSHRLVRTPSLTLRPLMPEDRAEFIRVLFLSREHLRGLVPMFAPRAEGVDDTPAEALERQLERTALGDRHGTAWRRVAVTRDGRIVGGFILRNIERGLTHTAEATLWTAADAKRKGHAEEGLDAMLRFAFMDLPSGLGLHRVTAAIRPDNAPSLSLARKLGFRALPNSRTKLEIDGDWVDHDQFVIHAEAVQAAARAG